MTGKWDLEKGHFAHLFVRISCRAAAQLTDLLGVVHRTGASLFLLLASSFLQNMQQRQPQWSDGSGSGSGSGSRSGVAAADAAAAPATAPATAPAAAPSAAAAAAAAEAAAAVAAAAAAAAVMVVGTQQSTKQRRRQRRRRRQQRRRRRRRRQQRRQRRRQRRQQHRSSTSSGCLGFASPTPATQTALVFKWRQRHRALLWAGQRIFVQRIAAQCRAAT